MMMSLFKDKDIRVRLVGVVALVAALLAGGYGCRPKVETAASDDDVLVQVGDSVLTMQEVVRKIPSGLDAADSAQFFHTIVDNWVSDLVLLDVAENNITDMARIDRMVDAYRRNLIVNEYLASMSERTPSSVSEKRIREYYDNHRDEFTLQQPLIRGAFVRVDENDGQLDNLRRWMSRFVDSDIDNIEKKGLQHATAYEYFRDEWHPWNEIADKIPYRFFDADAFVRSTKNLETAADGSVYLLHLSDFIVSGEEMPYEYAKRKISEILQATDVVAMRNRLTNEIYRSKIEDGFLKPGLYDPIKGELRQKEQKKNKTTTVSK